MKCLYSTLMAALLLVVFASVPAGATPSFPSWSHKLTTTRFTVLTAFDSKAVLDHETGLVWEQSPSPHPVTWEEAQIRCNILTVGERRGWRLPTVQELASLVDPTQRNPSLPKGHPFSDVQLFFYWSATTNAGITSQAWGVDFPRGDVGRDNKIDRRAVWCVRGGQGVNPQ